MEAASQVNVAGSTGVACGHDSRRAVAIAAAGQLRCDAGKLRASAAEECAGDSGSRGAEHAGRRTIPAESERPPAKRKLAADAQRSGTVQQAANRGAAHDYVESLVSPSRAAVGVLANARRSGAGDLRAQRGREPIRLVHVAERAGAGAAGIAAGSAGAPGSGRRRTAFGRDREDGELRLELGRVALRAFGFFLAVDQRLELVVTLLADVFVNRHLCGPQCLFQILTADNHEGHEVSRRISGAACLRVTLCLL